MRQARAYKYYTLLELSTMLGISQKSTRNKLSKLGIKKHKTYKEGLALYTDEQLEMLRGDKPLNALSYEHLIHERNQAPVVITYYIYESKMNR